MSQINGKNNRYLAFQIGTEKYAYDISKKENIIEVPSISEMYNSLDVLKGTIDLNGTTLPVIDTRKKEKSQPKPVNQAACILVIEELIEGEPVQFGLLVETIHEVLVFDKNNNQPLHEYNSEEYLKFMYMIVTFSEQFNELLNMDKIFEHRAN